MSGIVSYGIYIPKYRIKLADIADTWSKSSDEIIASLKVQEKSVPAVDEDAVTIALESSLAAFASAYCKPNDIEALFVGSESHPYAVNPTSTIVGELLGVGNNYLAADLEFACKAATAGIEAIAGLIDSGKIKYGMAIGADTAQSKPHDVLEYTSASAGASFIMGSSHKAANLLAYTSYSSDTPDFWRRDGVRFPSHAGRFTGEPAYFAHVMGAAKRLIDETKISPSDIDYCVFHMPNGKFPRDVAARLGFSEKQLQQSLTVDLIGNPYSASSLIGLSSVLDVIKPGQKIFMVSYGSGAGSDAFLWQATDNITRIQNTKKKNNSLTAQQINHKEYVSYTQYLKQTHKI
jgi:hydroxymethylglutaryl-CoA synthase